MRSWKLHQSSDLGGYWQDLSLDLVGGQFVACRSTSFWKWLSACFLKTFVSPSDALPGILTVLLWLGRAGRGSKDRNRAGWADCDKQMQMNQFRTHIIYVAFDNDFLRFPWTCCRFTTALQSPRGVFCWWAVWTSSNRSPPQKMKMSLTSNLIWHLVAT